MVRILKTAFLSPNLTHTTRRESLLAKIRQQKGKRIILLKAGPGFGKTVLAASYYAEVENKIWLSIPKGYFSFFDLLIHLVYALHEHFHTTESEELLEYCQLLQTEELILQIINLMKAGGKGNLYIFLDDIHHLLFLEAEKEKLLELFISFLPGHVQVIMTSHFDLPFPTARFVQAGDFYQMEERYFTFTLSETRELLVKYGFQPTVEDLYRIDQISNGWISFIILLLNEPQGQGQDWSEGLKRMQGMAGNYLDQFLANLPLELQDFLVEISIFEFLDARICDHYLQRRDSQQLLNRLFEYNFIYPMENGLFGMHQLLRESLSGRMEPDSLSQKYALLAQVALEQQNLKAAIFYLIKGKQYLPAVQHMLECNDDRVRDILLMQQWLELIPQTCFQDNPLLYFYRGQVRERISQFPEALEDYQLASDLCRGKVDCETQHIITAHIIGLYWHRREFSLVVEMCEALLHDVKGNEYKTLSIVHNLLGTALIEQLQRSQGVEHLWLALENCRLSGVKTQEAWILNNLCYWEYIPNGDLVKAVIGYEDALEIFTEEQAIRGKTLIYMNLGNLYLRMGEVQKAKEMLDKTEQINIRLKNFNGMTPLFILQARAEILDHNFERAEDLLKQIPDLEGVNDFLRTQILLTHSYLAAEKGELEEGLVWADRAWNVISFRNNYLSMEFLLQKVRIYYLQHDYRKALEIVAEIKGIAEKWGYIFYLTEALFFEAALRKLVKHPDSAIIKQFAFFVEQKEMYFLLQKYPFLTEVLSSELLKVLKERTRATHYLEKARLVQTTRQRSSKEPILEASEPLRIHLFGEFTIRRGTVLLTPKDWVNKKALNLLKYLILNRGQSIQQSQILHLFWPDLEITKARQSMYVAMNVIRKMVEPGSENPKESLFLMYQRGYCKFEPQFPYWLDVEEYLYCYQQGRRALAQNLEEDVHEYFCQARSLYKSGLLPENLYDDWCKEYQREFQNMHIEMLLALLALLRKTNVAQALEVARTLLEIDPYLEEVNLTVLQLLSNSRNLKGVLEHYHKLVELYRNELGLEVPDEVEALVKKCTGIANGSLAENA